MSVPTRSDNHDFEAPRKRVSKPKVKTGCRTCRIRRVKCDEAKPACHRCVSTGRICDGYPSEFRIFNAGPSSLSTALPAGNLRPSITLYQPRGSVVTADEVNKLAHLFTMKPYGASVGYYTEAQATFAQLSDPAIRYALLSLSSLRDGFETKRYSGAESRTALVSINHGMNTYSTAVSSLASRLGEEPSLASAHAALLCCQLFISIETMLGDYASAVQHFLRGVRIMHQYRSRPAVSDDGQVLPRCSVHLPSPDSFVIKLFASVLPAPGQQARASTSTMAPAVHTSSRSDARDELATVSVQVLWLLGDISNLRIHDQVPELRAWRVQILSSLHSWERKYYMVLQERLSGNFPTVVQFHTAFSLLLYRILKIVVSLAMSSSAADVEALETDFQILSNIAGFATETKKLMSGDAPRAQQQANQQGL